MQYTSLSKCADLRDFFVPDEIAANLIAANEFAAKAALKSAPLLWNDSGHCRARDQGSTNRTSAKLVVGA
jgi:hypothetical protein